MTLAQSDAPQITEYLFSKLNFEPTERQMPILDCRKRFILVAGGEQAGKSMVASKYLVSRFLETDEPGLYWLVAADYERTRAEFDYLIQDFATLGILAEASKRVDPGRIVLADGTRIETKSAKDPRTLAMRAPNGIIGCEASQLDLESFHRMRGRCAPKRGWLFLAGTFEGSLGWYPQLFQSWQHSTEDEQSFSLPSYTNKHLYPGGKADPEILRLKAMASDEFFMERIEGIAVPPKGLVFPEFRPDVHVQQCEQIVGEPVYIWEDPGYSGSYHALEIANVIDGQVRIFDEIYMKGLITEEIVDIAMGREWWKEPAKYGVADIAATQHQSMPAVVAVWMQKAGLYMHTKKVGIPEGIERMKSFLKIDPVTHGPKIIVSPVCRGLISEFGAAPNPDDGQLRAYRWGTDREGNVVGTKPKDQFNDAIKAVTYGLVDRFGYAYSADRKKIRVKRW